MFEFLYSEGKFLGFYVGDNKYETSFKNHPVLWCAAQSFLRAVKVGYPGVPWKNQIRSLGAELKAVQEASFNDEFVEVIIDGIPKEAKERGVYPEDVLKERFSQVEKVARTVDLIPAEGSSLTVYIFSYIQSLLLLKSAKPIPQAELSNEKVDFSKLNTDDILQRAEYWINRDDLTQALKYMNLLKGAPRNVAKQWMNETRILLETQQAANIILTHAAFKSLMYL